MCEEFKSPPISLGGICLFSLLFNQVLQAPPAYKGEASAPTWRKLTLLPDFWYSEIGVWEEGRRNQVHVHPISLKTGLKVLFVFIWTEFVGMNEELFLNDP